MKNTKQGFATMDPEKQREIASKGGKAVAANKEHMSAIGSKGGKNVAKNREHMAEIGRKGGRIAQYKKKAKKIQEDLIADDTEIADEIITTDDFAGYDQFYLPQWIKVNIYLFKRKKRNR